MKSVMELNNCSECRRVEEKTFQVKVKSRTEKRRFEARIENSKRMFETGGHETYIDLSLIHI